MVTKVSAIVVYFFNPQGDPEALITTPGTSARAAGPNPAHFQYTTPPVKPQSSAVLGAFRGYLEAGRAAEPQNPPGSGVLVRMGIVRLVLIVCNDVY